MGTSSCCARVRKNAMKMDELNAAIQDIISQTTELLKMYISSVQIWTERSPATDRLGKNNNPPKQKKANK